LKKKPGKATHVFLKKKEGKKENPESFNAHCPDYQAADMLPPSTHCDLLDGMLQTMRAPNKSPRIGV